MDAAYAEFEFAKVSDALYRFAWDEFCDWYVELAKVSLNSGDEAQAANTRAVLGNVLDVLLRLLHPAMPFLTETLWTALTGRGNLPELTAALSQQDGVFAVSRADPNSEE